MYENKCEAALYVCSTPHKVLIEKVLNAHDPQTTPLPFKATKKA